MPVISDWCIYLNLSLSIFFPCSQDLAVICQQLNMEDAVDEIMQQLGADMEGRISFDEFVNCRMRLVSEIEQEKLRERGVGIDVPERRINAATASTMSWGSPAHDNILGEFILLYIHILTLYVLTL